MDPEETGQDTSTGTESEPVATESGSEQTPEGGESLNPAWNDLLGVVPEMLHSQVTPYLQQWDKNYQDSLNKVHSEYEPYKPYLENNVTPEQINYAMQVMQAVEERPQDVIAALQEYQKTINGETQETTQGAPNTTEQGQDDIPEFLQHPEVQRMKQMVETMSQILVQQNMANQQTAEDQALAEELSSLQTKFKDKGGFDEEWVLTRAANNPQVPMEKHVEAFITWKQGLLAEARKPPAAKVLSGGGSAPDNQADLKKLDDKGRRALVAQMLETATQNNG